ncbi:hypothetical protein J2Z66_002275 [Paenibacillus eucommiae]|uniref:Uncharacterized protein n=1 Tax=Paenibacillus eucommiae TaxID=1355755 RepID=A0ABS4ISW8_9BACL|nr:hypothetical protein [Paenibacillus eucommiae]
MTLGGLGGWGAGDAGDAGEEEFARNCYFNDVYTKIKLNSLAKMMLEGKKRPCAFKSS